MRNKIFEPLQQYYFNRDDFTRIFLEVFTEDEYLDFLSDCENNTQLCEFYLHRDEGEFYIIHLPSGTIVNWYKHLGRTNTCNKEGFTLEDLKEFLKRCKADWKGEELNEE